MPELVQHESTYDLEQSGCVQINDLDHWCFGRCQGISSLLILKQFTSDTKQLVLASTI